MMLGSEEKGGRESGAGLGQTVEVVYGPLEDITEDKIQC